MHEALPSKKVETNQTQTPAPGRMPQHIKQKSQDVTTPLDAEERKTSLWGNRIPVWLRLSTSEQVPEKKEPLQRQDQPIQSKKNATGLPDTLKAGIEALSGMPMDDVHVNYHSPEPAQIQALAYTQGTQIHVGPGQERHLAHEAWHVVQQKQGRVLPTVQARGVGLNEDAALEKEADVMGDKAVQMKYVQQETEPVKKRTIQSKATPAIQRKLDDFLPLFILKDRIEKTYRFFPESYYRAQKAIDVILRDPTVYDLDAALSKIREIVYSDTPAALLPGYTAVAFVEYQTQDRPLKILELLSLFRQVITKLIIEKKKTSQLQYPIVGGAQFLLTAGMMSKFIKKGDVDDSTKLSGPFSVGQEGTLVDLQHQKNTERLFFSNGSDASYKEIIKQLEVLKSSENLNDVQIAVFIMNKLQKKQSPNLQPASQHLINSLIALIFGVETSRNNLTFATGLMLLQLIAGEQLTFRDAFAKDDFGGSFPMASIGTGSGNLSAHSTALDQPDGFLKVLRGLPYDQVDQFWQDQQVIFKETALVNRWLTSFGLANDIKTMSAANALEYLEEKLTAYLKTFYS